VFRVEFPDQDGHDFMIKEKTFEQLKCMKRLFLDNNKRKKEHQRATNEHEARKRRKDGRKPTSSSRLPLRSPSKSPNKDVVDIRRLGIEEKKRLLQQLQEELMAPPDVHNTPDLPVLDDENTAAMEAVVNVDVTRAMTDDATAEPATKTPQPKKKRMCTHCQASPDHTKKECPFVVQYVHRSKKTN